MSIEIRIPLGYMQGDTDFYQLTQNVVEVNGKTIPTNPLSSYPMAKKIAGILKEWIEKGFTIGEPQIHLPTAEYKKPV